MIRHMALRNDNLLMYSLTMIIKIGFIVKDSWQCKVSNSMLPIQQSATTTNGKNAYSEAFCHLIKLDTGYS